jgi:hypothetical protein
LSVRVARPEPEEEYWTMKAVKTGNPYSVLAQCAIALGKCLGSKELEKDALGQLLSKLLPTVNSMLKVWNDPQPGAPNKIQGDKFLDWACKLGQQAAVSAGSKNTVAFEDVAQPLVDLEARCNC